MKEQLTSDRSPLLNCVLFVRYVDFRDKAKEMTKGETTGVKEEKVPRKISQSSGAKPFPIRGQTLSDILMS